MHYDNYNLHCVALRKESVDRNKYVVQCRKTLGVSLSARRAWIEILESKQIDPSVMQSLSARRAWIEIINNNYNDLTRPVALRKESVDRNSATDAQAQTCGVALRKESVDRNRWRS